MVMKTWVLTTLIRFTFAYSGDFVRFLHLNGADSWLCKTRSRPELGSESGQIPGRWNLCVRSRFRLRQESGSSGGDCPKTAAPESPDWEVAGLEKQAPGSGYQTENFGDVGQINKTRYIDSQAIRNWQ